MPTEPRHPCLSAAERERSEEKDVPWSGPVEPISEEDWFIKSNEFRLWLREERGKNLFEMETVRSR